MAFLLKKRENFEYKTPQEMYQDNKLKKIHGLLDYQSVMIDEYMKNMSRQNVALELPTGSGKTLIGLLIGEFRRKKNKEIVVFLCPTKQLVNQVVEQATTKFGIKATAFIGKQCEFENKDMTEFTLGETIGVTTYSAFFTQNFFSSVDIAIMDDVHSSEEYIASNWTLRIRKEDPLFMSLVPILQNVMSPSDYERLVSEDKSSGEINDWCELIPMTYLDRYNSQIYTAINNGIEEKSTNYYSWQRLYDNFENCNFFISNGVIVIRPWVVPTKMCESFAKLKQRILMSATLGKSGELERITGLEDITRLPIVNEWDKRGLGRRFFVMPDLALGSDMDEEIFLKLHSCTGRKSVVLTPDEQSTNVICNFVRENMRDTNVYSAKDIERSKTVFAGENDAVVVMANRFDGIDFSDDESRMLFIYNLPKVMNLQERFLVNKMGAVILYNERIRTRIIQAVGRCTRNPSDYSVVCILGETIRNDLIKPDKMRLFPSELRAELIFGVEQSTRYTEVKQVINDVKDFLEKTMAWEEAEEYIVNLRNEYYVEIDSQASLINMKLQNSAVEEIKFEYALWKKDYINAFSIANSIINILNAPSLGGYKCYWQYVAGSLAYRLFKDGYNEYKLKSVQLYKDALSASIKIQWFYGLINQVEQCEEEQCENYFDDIILNLERVIADNNLPKKKSKLFDEVLNNINSADGNKFEEGHKNLGTLLGYISCDSKANAAPDPYWIINSKLCIVSEDKIYDADGQSIPVKHVREALTHEKWLRANEKNIDRDCEIITVFITNATKIDDEAKIFADNIYYLNDSDIKKYADKAVAFISKISNTFIEIGNYEWREATRRLMIEEELTPFDFIKKVKAKKLTEI